MTQAVVMARDSTNFSPKYHVKIDRSITHSPETPIVAPSINFFNNLDWSSTLGAILNIVTFPLRFVIGLVKFCVTVYQVIAIIADLVNTFKNMFKGFTGEDSLENILGNSLTPIFDDTLADLFDGIDNDVENNLLEWSILGDSSDVWDDFENEDWGNLDSSFSGIFPDIDYNIINSNEDLSAGFWTGILGFGISDLWTPSINVFTDIVGYITLFVMLFFMSIMLRLLKGDFESLFRDASRIFHGIQFIIEGIIRIFEWIFDLISLILNVAIPFT